jgi:serine/threonine-protein kinase HipA
VGDAARLEAVTQELEVRFGAKRVGSLRIDERNQFCFRYVDAWLNDPARFPVSLTLPLGPEEEIGGKAHAFLANLLPEGSVREAICRRLQISESNDVELLRAIGGECAGALSVVTVDTPLELRPSKYREIDAKQLQQLANHDERTVPLLIGGPATRLSLAGAQEKLPVAVLDDSIHMSLDGSPTTHILKLPSRRFAHLPQNEAFVLGLARTAGLECAASKLLTRTKPPSLLVERYDRRRSETPWPALRLHQEDFCQALGVMPGQKYEAEGGPTLAKAIDVIRSAVVDPLHDVQRLIVWQVFNVATGNADGHGKNLSILYDGGARLAPLYDLVSTRAYAEIGRELAMSVGGSRNGDMLSKRNWRVLATDLDMKDRVVLDLVAATLQRIDAVLPAWTAEFRDAYGKEPILETLPTQIRRRVRRLSGALR